jgi:hypothetical protein
MLTPEKRLAHLELRVAELEEKLAVSSILSKSFLSRAFAVWGHYFVANMIIAIPFVILYLVALFAAFLR